MLSPVDPGFVILEPAVEVWKQFLDLWQDFGLDHVCIDDAVDGLGLLAIWIFPLTEHLVHKQRSICRNKSNGSDPTPQHHTWSKLLLWVGQLVPDEVLVPTVDNHVLLLCL